MTDNKQILIAHFCSGELKSENMTLLGLPNDLQCIHLLKNKLKKNFFMKTCIFRGFLKLVLICRIILTHFVIL